MEITLELIRDAYESLQGQVKHTPLNRSRTLSEMAGCDLYLKLENLQATGSFKIRGAFNKIRLLSDSERQRGVICASAGNHAQGVAFSAAMIGAESTVIMPAFAPPSKIQATRSYGAQVMLEGETYDDAYAAAVALSEKDGLTFVHAFDDPLIISGQGTLGLEILEDLPDPDVVIVPVGGGGLISGIGAALKHLKPDVEVVGVEADGADSMLLSLKAGKIIPVTSISTIADGIAVKTPGKVTFPLVRKYVDRMVTVNDEETAHALYLLSERAKLVAEPAGVVALAAALSEKSGYPGKKVVAVISGGNVDLSMLTQIVDRGLIRSGYAAKVAVDVPDRPRMLNGLLTILTEARANVRSISHDRMSPSVPVGHVRITITFRTPGRQQVDCVMDAFKEKKLKHRLLT